MSENNTPVESISTVRDLSGKSYNINDARITEDNGELKFNNENFGTTHTHTLSDITDYSALVTVAEKIAAFDAALLAKLEDAGIDLEDPDYADYLPFRMESYRISESNTPPVAPPAAITTAVSTVVNDLAYIPYRDSESTDNGGNLIIVGQQSANVIINDDGIYATCWYGIGDLSRGTYCEVRSSYVNEDGELDAFRVIDDIEDAGEAYDVLSATALAILLSDYQPLIDDLSTIRSNATAGAAKQSTSITDANNYFTTDTVEGALDELAEGLEYKIFRKINNNSGNYAANNRYDYIMDNVSTLNIVLPDSQIGTEYYDFWIEINTASSGEIAITFTRTNEPLYWVGDPPSFGTNQKWLIHIKNDTVECKQATLMTNSQPNE